MREPAVLPTANYSELFLHPHCERISRNGTEVLTVGEGYRTNCIVRQCRSVFRRSGVEGYALDMILLAKERNLRLQADQ